MRSCDTLLVRCLGFAARFRHGTINCAGSGVNKVGLSRSNGSTCSSCHAPLSFSFSPLAHTGQLEITLITEYQ